MSDFQSGKTQAIDLDELRVDSANRPQEPDMGSQVMSASWGDDPWLTTEESRKRRRWAEDDRWAGQDAPKSVPKPKHDWDNPKAENDGGWNAPKRGDILETSDDWGGWSSDPKELKLENDTKENGGSRKIQAATQYEQDNQSDYSDGRARRDDIYHQKEVYGTANIPERRGDPYASNAQNPNIPSPPPASQVASAVNPIPEMKLVDEWNPDDQDNSANEDDMRHSAKINQAVGGDDIPGITRASIIIFQAHTESVVYEIKKLSTPIGRALDNLVILNDKYASRQHCVINYVGGKFELFALSRGNSTTVNGYPVSHVVLMNGDIIEAGATRIKFVLGQVTSEMMTMFEPVNGKPMHLEPPPSDVRSPQTTKKNLILLIAGVAMAVLIMGILIIVVATGKNNKAAQNSEKSEIAANSETSKESSGIEQVDDDTPKAADPTPKTEPELPPPPPPKPKLDSLDKVVVNNMVLALGSGIDLKSSKHKVNSVEEDIILGDVVHFRIETDPPGAAIYNPDGSLRGTTVYRSTEHILEAATETWTIKLEGYVDKPIEVNLKDGLDQTIKLESVEKAPEPKPQPKSGGGGTSKSGGGKSGGSKSGGSKSGGDKGGGGGLKTLPLGKKK